ncbi:uncharacterized protein [Dysidea avara]|uniref:uncharacterized protein n=1 Tax=Dysidea avara TaxID=196820 RepID=UPI003318334A
MAAPSGKKAIRWTSAGEDYEKALIGSQDIKMQTKMLCSAQCREAIMCYWGVSKDKWDTKEDTDEHQLINTSNQGCFHSCHKNMDMPLLRVDGTITTRTCEIQGVRNM